MVDSPNLSLPYLIAAQAQKHITHNEALRKLDAIVQLAVLDKDLTAPPPNPNDGDRYIIAAPASDQWAGFESQIAAWQDGAWAFYSPRQGWLAWVGDEAALYGWDGNQWAMAGGSLNPTPLLGINATADSTNRLALASPTSLFNHEGSDHRLKINKNTPSDTASILFQTGFSGRAEFGLTGDEDWHVKVSADGNNWKEALRVDNATGRILFPSGGVRHQLSSDKTWFVDGTTGADSNDGGTAATPFATISKAVATVIATDLGGYKATIQIADGTYTENLLLLPLIAGSCSLRGNLTNPANVILDNGGVGENIVCSGLPEQWSIEGLRLIGNRIGIEARGGHVLFGNLDFATSFIHMRANYNGTIRAIGDYTISGSANEHLRAANNAAILMWGKTVTLSGSLSFATSFARAQNRAFIRCNGGMNFIGSATGKRYSSEEMADINTGGGGANFFPGDSAGSVSLGGVYV